MFIHASSKMLLLTLTTGLTAAALLSGCPTAQQPTVPADNQEEVQAPAPPASDGDLLRPTLPSSPEEEPEGGATADGGGRDDSGSIFIAVVEPESDVAVRPSTPVDVRFILYDSQGAMLTVQLVLARDDDADGEADGPPVFAETLSFHTGQNLHQLDTTQAQGLLQDGFGRFLIGLRCETVYRQTQTLYAPGSLSIDSQVPTAEWISPDQDLLLNCSECVQVRLSATDNRPVTVQVCLDPDLVPSNGNQRTLIPEAQLPAGTSELSRSVDLQGFPLGTFYYGVTVSDGIEPTCSFYAHSQGTPRVLVLTNRLVGEFDLNQLADSDQGAVLQAFNFNDLAGSSMAAVPDLDDDGDGELLIASRFGEPYLINESGIGFGEAYLLYGDSQRLRGIRSLNAVGNPGQSGIPGLVFPGIRMPMNRTWTEGIADALVLNDMDGDDLPELVFGFPRVESLALNDPAFGYDGTAYQHPDLLAHPPELGELEFSVARENFYSGWTVNRAQFTRGGIVIVSSHNEILMDHDLLNRRGDRVVDLHEVGQTFTSMVRSQLIPYIALVGADGPLLRCEDCEPDESDENDPGCPDAENCVPDGCDADGDMWDHEETLVQSTVVLWDVVFQNQGPGGFQQPWTVPAVDPPLANPSPFTWALGLIDLFYPPLCCACDNADGDPNTNEDRLGCESSNEWYVWGGGLLPFPCASVGDLDSWNHYGDSVWTGFYPLDAAPLDYTVGARVLGQQVDDRFGTAVATDGTFLYISAPRHTPTIDDVPQLTVGKDYTQAGVVYAYRIRRFEPTRAQLWIEPGGSWPNVDEENPGLSDYTMPVPHQYLIEDVGSPRNDALTNVAYSFAGDECLPAYSTSGGAQANFCGTDHVRWPGTAGYDLDRVSQIVGPHRNARIELVRGLGDVNSDGSGDYAITCPNAWADFDDDASGTVGAIFVLFERPTGEGGDLLIERVAAQANPLRSLWVKGTADAPLGHAVDGAGDFNGDDTDDVILGSPDAALGRGEAIVVFGSNAMLQSPPEGATFDDLVQGGLATRFLGEQPGDLAGANVGGAGDVDGDGMDDILIAAPAGQAGRGVVYLIYGAPFPATTIELALVGSPAVPGVRFLGRGTGSFPGSVEPGFARTVNPEGIPTQIGSRGLTTLGDLDGDGLDDYAISAIQADPAGRTDAGEIYVLYGRGE
jgi:hypothetical protein